jgi:DNA polymerase-3 subunit beta
METGELATAIDQTVIAASTDRGRPVLMGVLLTSEGDGTRLVATDSYRLAIRELPPAGFLPDAGSALLPARALAELSRLVAASGDETKVEVGVTERQVAFRVGETVVIASLIEGEFPSYGQLIPDEYAHRLEFDRDSLLDALRRVGLLARDSTPVRLDLGGQQVVLRAIDPELGGEASEEIDASYVGDEMTIAFNPTYLRDGIEACGGERVQIEVLEPLKPAMLSMPGTTTFKYLLMPVRV